MVFLLQSGEKRIDEINKLEMLSSVGDITIGSNCSWAGEYTQENNNIDDDYNS